ncbi:MAG: hypothetical protein R6U85_14165, partial [Salinivirgaceae bacterium]
IRIATADNPEFRAESFFADKQELNIGVGGGFRVAMNQNFVVALDIAQSLNKQYGNTGIYIGLNYLF